MTNLKTFKSIDSILHVTKDVIHKSNNYYEYMIKQNNTLYKKQLPLLMKNSRINALVLSKTKERFFKNFQSQNKEEEVDEKKVNFYKKLSPLNNIRNIKIRSKKIPPLCPLYNNRGELVPSIIKTSKVLYSSIINYNDNINSINHCLSSEKITKRKLGAIRLNMGKLRYNKSCNFEIKLNFDEYENNFFNEPEYDKLIYDEKKIFGQRKLYEEIIRKKLIELQTIYNKNNTTQKEKIFNFGLQKKKMHLNFDSLKIKINEIKDENGKTIEIVEKPKFEFALPFALLPLFYYKGVDHFLMIISKLIIYNEITQTFQLIKEADKMIANILENCTDFDVFDDNNISSNRNNNNENENNNEINNIDYSLLNSSKKSFKKVNKNINNNNNYLYENKNISLNNSFINNQTPSSVNRSSIKNQNSLEAKKDRINDITNFSLLNINLSNKNSFHDIKVLKKKLEIKTHDIYPVKYNDDFTNISIYDFLWITENKSYILTIELPLITVHVPSHNSTVKKYINYELLFYIYHKNFIMWHFYIIKYLSSFKNFRIFLEQLNSIPERKNMSFFIIQPKHKRNLSTFYEMTSIITRETNRKFVFNENFMSENDINNDNSKSKNNTASKSPRKKKHGSVKIRKIKKNSKEKNNNNPNKQKFLSKSITGIKKSNLNNKSEENTETENKSDNNNTIDSKIYYYSLSRKNLNFLNFNSIFIQKGLLFIASFINTERVTIKEYTFHFNLDQLRKFQLLESLGDKLSFFVKFANINYEKESISFNFEAFNSFDVSKWVEDVNKYNFKFCNDCKPTYEENKTEDVPLPDDVRMMRVFPGLVKNTKIKIEMKCPLIIMKALDEFGFKTTEKVNVDYNIEKKISNLKNINNSLELTKQLLNILKDNNFCRRVYISNRNNLVRNSTSKDRQIVIKDNGVHFDNEN